MIQTITMGDGSGERRPIVWIFFSSASNRYKRMVPGNGVSVLFLTDLLKAFKEGQVFLSQDGFLR
ncbi:hypothetical protein ACFFF2_09500 [Scopulibacillus daqui]